MRQMLLKTSNLGDIPADIKVLDNWGSVSVVDSNGGPLVAGDHVHLEGPCEAFINWLKPFDEVWITKRGTSPMEQVFEAVHIKDDL